MPITDVLEAVFSVAKLIYKQAETAKSNQAQCKTLAERVKVVMTAITPLGSVADSDRYRPGLLALQSHLNECLVFTQMFSKEGWFKQIIKAGNSKAKFESLTEQLQKDMTQLNLGLAAQQIMNREQDKKDQAADLAHIKDQQDEIIRLSQEAQGKLDQIQIEQAECKDVFMQQLASIKRHIGAMGTPQEKARPP